MTLFRLAVILLLLTSSTVVNAQLKCESLFLANVQIEQAIRDLAHLRLELDIAKAEKATTPHMTALREVYPKKEAALIRYVEQRKIMSREELIAELKQVIDEIQVKRQAPDRDEMKKKAEQSEQIRIKRLSEQILFHKIAPGSLYRELNGNRVYSKVKNPFQMASVLTTQVVWQKVILAAKLRFPGSYDGLPEIPSDLFIPLNPVVLVSYVNIVEWFKALNALAQADDAIIFEFLPGHERGDSYRLPTAPEWNMVALDRGLRLEDRGKLGDSITDIGRFAWISDNANMNIQPVATKAPLLLSGGLFYDIYGNVWQFTSTPARNFLGIEGGCIIRGGSVRSSLGDSTTGQVAIDKAGPEIGFRLVRVSK